jgi:transcription-repair coupling factor (superfamily II helicase)
MSLKPQPAFPRSPASPLRPLLPAPGAELAWEGLYGSSRGLAIAQAAQAHAGPILLVTASARAAQQLEDEIRFYRGDSELPVLPFPDWESLPYDAFSPYQDIISQRLLALHRLPGLRRGIVIVPVTTLMHRLAPRAYIEGNTFLFGAGDALDLEALRQRLQASGYHNVTQVMAPGEFAVRGGLVDLFPMGTERPFRLDLFGEEIESIREFDPETQLSLGKTPRIKLLPAREYPLTPEAIQRFRQAFRVRFEGDPQRVPLYREVSKGMAPAGIEYYLPLFFEQTATFFDYLPDSTLCILDEGIARAAQAFEQDTAMRYESLRHDLERPLLPPAAIFLSAQALLAGLDARARVRLPAMADNVSVPDMVTYDSAPPPLLPVSHKADQPYVALFQFLQDYPGRILLVAETTGRREVLRTLLIEHGFHPTPVDDWAAFLAGDMPLALACAELEKGLLLHAPAVAVITEPQLYGERAAQRRRRARTARDPEAIIRDLGELKVGDPVVHEDHGVGRYLGLQALDVGGALGEFLTLEYAGADKLYIPVTALHLITRYTGTDPERAPLHKLGSDAWDKAKRRAHEKAHDAAAELLELYALRAARQGHAFVTHGPQYHSFAAAFPFEETPDQAKAIDDVLADMEQPKPMDRLVCGDVGFGKTEVAMRAAFLAVQDRHQVAVLVPTTLLAAQHYQNFRDRFADLAINIELLSRFRTKGEQEKALNDLAQGRVDIIIGTHRLLQDDVRFKHLGLVIIDEEHRFGVRQKERLKKLRSEVDVLTLTATPVPRTLNLALSGLRDVSLITTAPQQRLSIKTFVTQWNDALIREACLRELRRGGQVFFLHNDVKTMTRAVERLQALVPEADIRMAHGQMPERELEQVMLDFYHQRFNILVCSTIIETGIDIPTANTIVIERADKFGLAQLHQLRGRVGRSHHRAYAYLLVPPHGLITADAQKRLDAIGSLEDLGVGFTLASHDLEIRGAGELLGEAQSGQIDEVGFAMYSDLLNRAVESLRLGKPVDFEAPDRGLAELDLHVPALLPDDYIPDPHMRLILYKRIAGATDNQALDDLEAEIIDRFGFLPEASKTLFKVTRLKLLALPLGVRKIEAGPKGARIEFRDQPNIDPARIIRLLQLAPRLYKLDGPNRMRIVQDLPDGNSRIETLRTLLQKLGGAG